MDLGIVFVLVDELGVGVCGVCDLIVFVGFYFDVVYDCVDWYV